MATSSCFLPLCVRGNKIGIIIASFPATSPFLTRRFVFRRYSNNISRCSTPRSHYIILIFFHASTRSSPSVENDREILIFPVQLTTSRIGSLTRLIHTLPTCDDNISTVLYLGRPYATKQELYLVPDFFLRFPSTVLMQYSVNNFMIGLRQQQSTVQLSTPLTDSILISSSLHAPMLCYVFIINRDWRKDVKSTSHNFGRQQGLPYRFPIFPLYFVYTSTYW